MEFFDKIQAVWQNVSLIQRALLIAIVLTFLIVGGIGIHWARRPDMAILYSSLDPEDASKIAEKMSEKDIPYKLQNGGTAIYAPRQDVPQLRLDMAREGLPAGEQGGYKIFDNEKIGVSPFVQDVNLKRALQEELAKSIQMIDGVAYARVHIVSTERNIFTSQASETSASIALRLRPGYTLSALNIAAITHLVAGSVSGLKSEKVTVIDSQGRLLSSESDSTLARGAGTVQAYKERVEQGLKRKLEDMLTAVLGANRATVNVWATIDMNSVSTIRETHEPKGVVKKEEIQTGSETGAAVAAGGEGITPGSVKKDETITTEYEVGKTIKEESIPAGRIMSLKVAAFVDLSVATADANEAGGSTAKIMQVTDVQEIIQNALGLDDPTSIKVVDVKFNRPLESLAEEEPSSWPRYMAMIRQGSLGVMAICAFLVLRIFRGAKQKVPKGMRKGKGAAGELPATVGSAGLLPGEAEGGIAESLVLRRQIAGALQSNPEHVKRLFASWIEEKGD